MKTSVALSLLALLFGALAPAPPASAQEAEEAGEPRQPQETPAPPAPIGSVQIAARASALADSAAHAERIIDGLRAIDELTAEVEEAEARYRELQTLQASMIGAEFVRLVRLSRLRDQALLEDGRLEGVRERLMERLAELEGVDARWVERRELWSSWLEALRSQGSPDRPETEAEVTAALQRIQDVLEAAAAAADPLFALDGRVGDLRADVARLSATVTAIQDHRRQARFERAEPLLFSEEHRAQLEEGGWRAWDPTASIRPQAYWAFARGNVGLLAFHALLAVLIGGAVRALPFSTAREGEGKGKAAGHWSGLPEHPWALGVFASVVVAMTRITLAPPLWDVLLWLLFGATAAILVRRLTHVRALRLTVYLLAGFYPVFLLLEVSQVPEPVFRLGLAAVAACAAPLFLLLARDEGSASGSDPRSLRAMAARAGPLRLGAGIWIVVLGALVLGYDSMARWVLRGTVMSAAVAFTVMLGFVLVRGTDSTLSHLADEGPLARRAAVLLARRLTLVLRVVFVVVGALVIVDVWGVSGSPLATWQRVMDAGFEAGSLRVTLGRILLGAFVVYLAVLLSGLVRSLVTSSAQASRTPEGGSHPLHSGRGLAESITRLGQYAFVTLGAILALALIGVELQNFAIIAGALGIGVGFGLQNVVNNFASGLILLFERPVRVGDTVVVGDSWGTIQKIGLRSTVMLTLDESEMIVPNGHLVSEKVINWTLTSPMARVFLPVSVAYGSPVEQVQEILGDAAFAHPAVLKEPPPQALFMAFADSSLDFELRVWVENIRLRMEVRSTVLGDIDRRLREAGIVIPFPQRDLHLRSVDGKALGQALESDPGGSS